MFKILIAECEYLEREVIKKIAYKIDNNTLILESAAGSKTVELAVAFNPNLIFLSMQLGGVNTYEILRKIRDAGVHPTIILTTNYTKNLNEDELSNIEVAEYLLKPIRPSVIEEIIKKRQLTNKSKSNKKIKKSSKNLVGVYPPSLMSKEIKDTLKYIDENYTSEVTLDYLADRVFLSSYYFSRLFKKEVGVTLSSYIVHKKIETSKTLLAETDKTVLEISTFLNFKEQTYFCKVFKKHVGVSPTEYRNSNNSKPTS